MRKWEVKILCSVLTVTALLLNMGTTKHSGALQTKISHLSQKANIWNASSVCHIVLKVSPPSCTHLAYTSCKQTWASSVHAPWEVLCQDTFLGLGLWQCLMHLIKPHRLRLSTILIKEIWSSLTPGKVGSCLRGVYHVNTSWVHTCPQDK